MDYLTINSQLGFRLTEIMVKLTIISGSDSCIYRREMWRVCSCLASSQQCTAAGKDVCNFIITFSFERQIVMLGKHGVYSLRKSMTWGSWNFEFVQFLLRIGLKIVC